MPGPTTTSPKQDEGWNRDDPAFLSNQLITYIGNKRQLLPHIAAFVRKALAEIGAERSSISDVFSGSSVVSRLLKQFATTLHSNDLELYAAVMAQAFLTNQSSVDWEQLKRAQRLILERFTDNPIRDGFIRRLYAPKDEANIQVGERVFYTIDNAIRLDTFASEVASLEEPYRTLLLGPLISEASVHANTSGIFKGFHKDRQSGRGKYGGTNADALTRIRGEIELNLPTLSRFESASQITQMEALAFAKQAAPHDIAYLDPPYNQHPYGSNYFMLNHVVNYHEPREISAVSGIPKDWQRSPYNKKARALPTLLGLIDALPASFIILSFNTEGFISEAELDAALGERGRVEKQEIDYNVFRGSRNLHGRTKHVTELLYLLRK